jgi:hypothetical protein
MEAEARILGDLANAYRLAGDLNSALKTVTEAIETAIARNARVSECLSRMVHAEVLWALTDVNQAREELSRAVVLMRETGALIFQPMLNHLGGRIAGRAPQSGNLMSESANALH